MTEFIQNANRQDSVETSRFSGGQASAWTEVALESWKGTATAANSSTEKTVDKADEKEKEKEKIPYPFHLPGPLELKDFKRDADAMTRKEMTRATQESRADWDKDMNSEYSKLKQSQTETQNKSLLDSQRKWLEYRNAEFKNIDSIYAKHQNDEQTILQGEYAKTKIVKDRAIELHNRNGDYTYGDASERFHSNHPIDEKYLKAEMLPIDSLGFAADEWSEELQKSEKDLLTKVSPEQARAYKTANAAWEKFQTAEANYLVTIFDQKYSGNRLSFMQETVDMIRKRALQVEAERDIATRKY